MDYDDKNKHKVTDAIAFAGYDQSTEPTSAAADTMGWKALTAAICVGIGGITFTTTNKIEFKITHSDDNVTYVAVTDDEVLLDYGGAAIGPAGKSDAAVGTGGIVKSIVAAHAALEHVLVGYRGKKRYVKIFADFGGTHSSTTPLGVKWFWGHPISLPQAQGDYDDSHDINL